MLYHLTLLLSLLEIYLTYNSYIPPPPGVGNNELYMKIFYRGRPLKGLPLYDYIIIYDEEMLCEVVQYLSKALFDEFRVNLVQQYV